MLGRIKIGTNGLTAVAAGALLAAGIAPAQAATIVHTGTPTIGADGSGNLDLSSVLGLTASQKAVFTSATAIFSFTAADLYYFSGTSYQYVSGGGDRGSCSRCEYYSWSNYNQYNTYSPTQSVATVAADGVSAEGRSSIAMTETYVGSRSENGGYRHTNYYTMYDRIYHTGGDFTAELNLGELALEAVGESNSFDFQMMFSNPQITFNNVTFSGEYTVENLNVVPEPGSWAMMIIGFMSVGAAMRTRRKPALAA